MTIFDSRFSRHKLRYVVQCAFVAVAMMIILAATNHIASGALVAALGASALIVFIGPETRSSRPRYLIGGYVVGIVVGSLCSWISSLLVLPETFWLISNLPLVVFGSLSVGLATFVMVTTNTEHPPAAAVSLGLVLLKQWTWTTPVALIVGIVALCLVKRLFQRALKNLF